MFGYTKVRKGDVFKDLVGTPEENEVGHFNVGLFEFRKTLASPEAEPIEDEVLRKLSLMSLHDACYGLVPSKSENQETETHSSLYPVSMKDAYNIYGEGSLMHMAIEEYVMLDIGKYTLMTLGDWMHLTYHEQKTIRTIVDKKKSLESRINQEIVDDMKEASKVEKK